MNIAASITQATFVMATPLLFAALGENVVQRAGVVNVGLEGMMLTGAFAATLGALATSNANLGVAVAALAGMAVALLFAIFVVKLAANQVVVGVVVNLLAVGLTGTVYRARFGATGSFVSTAAVPKLGIGVSWLTIAAVCAVPCIWWGLHKTRRGLELRSCGEYPPAAAAAGIDVNRYRTLAILFGGAMAGIAGAFLSVAENNTFIPEMTNGRGFIALAIVTSGRWSPVGCLIAALVFGFADELQFQGQALNLHVPHDLLLAAPYFVTLLLLSVGGRWSSAPAGLGKPYRRT
jgi:simple sugar transport system permease protein